MGLPWFVILGLSVVGFYALVWVISKVLQPRRFNPRGKVVVITGGSQGIGLSAAEQLVQQGARVALLSRRQGPLDEAKAKISQSCSGNVDDCVLLVPTDVSDLDACTAAMEATVKAFGRIDAVVNCAGFSIPKSFEDLSTADWDNMYRVNVLGTRNATYAALPYLKERRGSRVVLTSSMAGQASFYGFTAYSATKFALVGFGQALANELHPHGLYVSVVFPPDTETPGFEAENKMKPAATHEMSESGGRFTPDAVAACLVEGMVAGDFAVGVGFDGFMLNCATAGMSPATLWQGLVQASLASIMRVVAMGYVFMYNRIARKHVKVTPGRAKSD